MEQINWQITEHVQTPMAKRQLVLIKSALQGENDKN